MDDFNDQVKFKFVAGEVSSKNYDNPYIPDELFDDPMLQIFNSASERCSKCKKEIQARERKVKYKGKGYHERCLERMMGGLTAMMVYKRR